MFYVRKHAQMPSGDWPPTQSYSEAWTALEGHQRRASAEAEALAWIASGGGIAQVFKGADAGRVVFTAWLTPDAILPMQYLPSRLTDGGRQWERGN